MSRKYNVLSLFTGSAGLDLGFEKTGFSHIEAVEINEHCVSTLKHNRPQWKVFAGDINDYTFAGKDVDVMIGGPPCQGFSLGGNRRESDMRNMLYKQMVRIAKDVKPRIVVLENVLNLRTMMHCETGRPFANQIAKDFEDLGYNVFFDIFKVSHYGVPQTRRRFIFIAIKGNVPIGYHLPRPDIFETSVRNFIFDLGQDLTVSLPNHDPLWGFKSAVHVETHAMFNSSEHAIPVRFSRTGSDGHPIRSFDVPFPAVDTATVWGWAQGHVQAKREAKDRKNGIHIRNPNANVTLWRIRASRLRSFTHREYARLQTFPDNWFFCGNNKRDIQLQIGNAVPVNFAARIADNVKAILEAQDQKSKFYVPCSPADKLLLHNDSAVIPIITLHPANSARAHAVKVCRKQQIRNDSIIDSLANSAASLS